MTKLITTFVSAMALACAPAFAAEETAETESAHKVPAEMTEDAAVITFDKDAILAKAEQLAISEGADEPTGPIEKPAS